MCYIHFQDYPERSLDQGMQHPLRHAEDRGLTSDINYALVDKERTITQLWNNIHKYHDSRKLKITIIDEISWKFCCARTAGKAESRSKITNILLNFRFSI